MRPAARKANFQPVGVIAHRHHNRTGPRIRFSSGSATLTADAAELSGFGDGNLLAIDRDGDTFRVRHIKKGEYAHVQTVVHRDEVRLNGLKMVLKDLGCTLPKAIDCQASEGEIIFDVPSIKEGSVV